MSTIAALDVCLRPERQADAGPIRHVNTVAFEREAEADLVEALRKTSAVTLSAVAVMGAELPDEDAASSVREGKLYTGETYGGEVVGHILFTPVTVDTGGSVVQLLGLGPVAVLPAKQHGGIGTLMIAGCLEYLRARGHRGVVVLGEPGFYRRFGFIEADRFGLRCGPEVPEEAFMALSLTPGVLGGMSGVVSYRPEFGRGSE